MHLNIIIFSMMPLETLFDFSFRPKNWSCASFHKNWGRRREGRRFDGQCSISFWRNFLYRAYWVRKVDLNISLFLIFKIGVLLSLANFVKAMVFNFLVDWLRPRWIRGSFLRQILLKETIHYCCTGTNMRIQIHNRTVVYWESYVH